MHEIVEVRNTVEIGNQFFYSYLDAQRCLMMLGYHPQPPPGPRLQLGAADPGKSSRSDRIRIRNTVYVH